jgi:AraC-like DNA-binding protein
VWFLRQAVSDAHDDQTQRIPPDGTIELIIHLDAPFSQIEEDRSVTQPRSMIVGVWTKPIALVAPRTFDTVGIRIRPGAWPVFFAEPAALFTDRVTDAAAVWNRATRQFSERLASLSDDRARVGAIAAFLGGCLRLRTRRVDASVARILSTRGCERIELVARGAGISSRQLERTFRNDVGVPPKMLSRIVRFQRVLRAARPAATAGLKSCATSGGGWAEIAVACGYTDQAHLIRDFRQFMGETPAALAASEAAIADYFRRR